MSDLKGSLLSPARVRVVTAVLILIVFSWLMDASPGRAAEAITKASIVPTTTQAGGHPDVKITTEWRMRRESPRAACNCDDARVITTNMPTGFIGNPHSLPSCSLTEFSLGECPEEAQVGYFGLAEEIYFAAPAYNMDTHPDQAGLIAWKVPLLDVPVFLDIGARTESDYGLVATAGPIYHILPVPTIELTLWGVPADPIHDPLRWKTPLSTGCLVCAEFNAHSNAPEQPYLQNPTTCGIPLNGGVEIEYYTGNTLLTEVPYPPTTGCDNLSFNPSLTAQPTTSEGDTASGLDVNLKVPQTQSPSTPSPSEIREATVSLPAGFTVNPNAADGKTACSDVDSAIGLSRGPATCPEFSKVGTLMLDSSALPAPIPGAVYLGEPKPGNRYRVILSADGFGTHIKLAGSLLADPETGQLTMQFTDLPQSPLSEFDVHLFGSERGLLVTPDQCGTYPVESEFVPWDSSLSPQSSTSYFSIDRGPHGGPCLPTPHRFEPSLQAGTADISAGVHSPFFVRVSRNDEDQQMVGLNVRTPRGFSATLKGTTYCPEAAIETLMMFGYSGLEEQSSPACPATSDIGGVMAAVGAGSHPLYVPGRVYLAGPYEDSPLSLVVVLPAVSGPYDLGTVAVRVAVRVNPKTAQVSAASDPFPQILEGIPLRTRLIQVSLDRPGFTLNPTHCGEGQIEADVTGDEGGAASLRQHFEVANCSELPYKPSLLLRLSGGMNRKGHPAIHATVSASPGEANSDRVTVTLPRGELLDNSHIQTICTNGQFESNSCPPGSLIGSAEAVTPLLANPLRGQVYLRSSEHKLPDIGVKLSGQFQIELSGRTDSIRGRLRTTFQNLPDVPISSFSLNLLGGSKGLVINSESLCGSHLSAQVHMVGQNGTDSSSRAGLKTACSKAGPSASRRNSTASH